MSRRKAHERFVEEDAPSRLGAPGSTSTSAAPPPPSLLTIPLGLRGRFALSFLVAALGTWALSSQATRDWRQSLVWFWYDDLPGLSGVTRIYIYLGLLVTALVSGHSRPHLGDSPLQAPELLDYTLPKFFSLEGAMKLINSDKWINHTMIHLLRMCTLVAFVCCVVGLGGQLPPIIVGLGVFLMHGVVQGCIGTSHRWYVPVYTCLALMFANGNGDLSLDAYFAKEYGSTYPFQPVCWTERGSSILCSGFARKMILMCAISTLFFGAITKIMNGGWAWLDGKSLSYYVSSEENGRSVFLKDMMAKHRIISLFLSFASIGLEAGSIVAVFYAWTRPLIIASAAGMHLGIWLTMHPNYFPQTLCYMVGMSWGAIDIPATSTRLTSAAMAPIWIAIFIWIFLSMIALLRIEYWPLTGIPMYSFYRDSSYSYKFLRDAHQAQSVALEHLASGYPNAIAWSNLWVNLRLKNMDPSVIRTRKQRREQERNNNQNHEQQADSAISAAAATAESGAPPANDESEYVNLKTRVTDDRYVKQGAKKGVYMKQWRRTLHNIAALDMAEKPWGRIDEHAANPGVEYPGHRWLLQMRPYLRAYARSCAWNLPAWAERSGELQLRVKLKDSYAVLATLPWNPNSSRAQDYEDDDNVYDQEDAEMERAFAAKRNGRK